MGRWLVVAFVLVAHAPLAGSASALDPGGREFYQLDNGLQVVLWPQPQGQRVAVSVRYNVGQRHDPPSRRGLAHLAEHLLFLGSQHSPRIHAQSIEELGSTAHNGFVTRDQTVLFQEVPPSALAQTLWLERDRMAFLLGRLDADRLATAKQEIDNESRHRGKQDHSLVSHDLSARLLYPKGHPYHTLGERNRPARVTLAEAQWFIQRFYSPSNARLTVVGRFDPAVARDLIARYFGPIRGYHSGQRTPRGPIVRLRRVKRKAVARRFYYQELLVVWPTPPTQTRQSLALAAFAGMLQAQGFTAKLVEDGLAVNAGVQQVEGELGSEFTIRVHLLQTVPLRRVIARLNELLTQALERGVNDDDLRTLHAGAAVHYEQVRGSPADLSVLLGRDRYVGQLVNSGDLGAHRYAGLEAGQVTQVARRYLPLDRRVEVHLRYSEAGTLRDYLHTYGRR